MLMTITPSPPLFLCKIADGCDNIFFISDAAPVIETEVFGFGYAEYFADGVGPVVGRFGFFWIPFDGAPVGCVTHFKSALYPFVPFNVMTVFVKTPAGTTVLVQRGIV